jgi:hypothetical protein
MTSTKFKNETINLQILKTGYGHWKFTIDTLEGKFTYLSTNSMLVDAINSDEDELTRYGTHQDCIDMAVKYVLDFNEVNY